MKTLEIKQIILPVRIGFNHFCIKDASNRVIIQPLSYNKWRSDNEWEQWETDLNVIVDALNSRSEWISVDDRLPSKAGFYPCKVMDKIGWRKTEYRRGHFESLFAEVTHWCELPD